MSASTKPTISAGSACAPRLRCSAGLGTALRTRSAKPDAMALESSTEPQSTTTKPQRTDWRTMDSRQARRVRAAFFVGTTTVTLALVTAGPEDVAHVSVLPKRLVLSRRAGTDRRATGRARARAGNLRREARHSEKARTTVT